MPDELTNTANRIVLEVDIATLNSGQYRGGVDTINVNSDMVNELVIRVGKFVGGKFVQSVLPNGERMWIDFAHGANTKTYVLAERPNTNVCEINNETIAEDTSGKEYYIKLPLEIMLQSGQWLFAISRKHVKSEVETEGEVPVYDEDDEIAYYRIVPTKSYVFDYVKTSEDYTMVVNTSIAQKSGFDHVTNATIQQIWDSIMAGAVTSINDQHGNVHTFKGVFNASNVYYAGDSLVYDDKLYLVIANRLTPSAVTPKNDTTHFKAYGGAIENIIWNGEILEKDADGNVEIPVDDEATEGSGNAITSGAVYTAIAEEAERATEAEANLSDMLGEEIGLRESGDADLAEQISNEATTRANADTQLQTSITAEVTRATGVESDLSDAIEAETEARETAVDGLQDQIDGITALIPNTASSANPLTDKAFVNSTVQTATANFRGNWNDWASVPMYADEYPADASGSTTPHTNDYMVVRDATGYGDHSQVGTWRFKYTGVWSEVGRNGWIPEYQVNETPLTAAQLAAINSGITESKVDQYDNYESQIADLEGDIDNLDSRVSANEADITSLGGRMTNAESDIDDLGQSVDSLETTVAGKEATANKVTTIDENSTDTEYPSAKAVYEAIQAGGGGVDKSSVVERANVLPEATASSPDFVAIEKLLYFKTEQEWDEPLQDGENLTIRQVYGATQSDETLNII